MASIRSAADAGDEPGYETIAREAHGLKGASQHVPAAEFTACAARLEHAATEGDPEGIRNAIRELDERWRSLREQLARFTGSEPDAN